MYGTNTYPADVLAVQWAVDNYDVVTLSGTFNFGQGVFGVDPNTLQITGTPAGSVVITRPHLTLQSDETSRATILGGGAPSEPVWLWPVIDIRAPGVTVRGLEMVGSADTGISFVGRTHNAGDTIRIERNTISALWGPLYFVFTGGVPIEVRSNTVRGFQGIQFEFIGLIRDLGQPPVQRSSRVDIIDNHVTFGEGNIEPITRGIYVSGWSVIPQRFVPLPELPPGTDLADWGDNGPVTISGNSVTCVGTGFSRPFRMAINLGQSASGVNHALVANNTITGSCQRGITKWPYGHDNQIIANDLSGLSSQFAITVMARNTTVANNVLGRSSRPPALLVYSLNAHPSPDPRNTPMPRPVENVTIIDNDYTRTGLPGWSQGAGSILVASEADLRWSTGVGTKVRNNLIAETGRFPEGTGGPANQIFELKEGEPPLVHDNRILGLPANHVSDPGIGQTIKYLRPNYLQ